MQQPTARRFRVQGEFGAELMLVDADHEVAHRLDSDAAAVFRACDGARDVEAIAQAAGVPAPRTETLLATLVERDIVETPAGDTRRALLRKLAVGGAATAMSGAVVSVLLPTAAQAFASRPLPETESPSVDYAKPPTGGSSAGSPQPADDESGQGGPLLRGASSGRRPPRSGPGRAGSPARPAAGPAPRVAGAGDTAVRGVPAGGDLPFTGSDLAPVVAAGAALAATGAAVRRALREDAPLSPDG